MNNDIRFLYLIAIAALCLGLADGIQLLARRKTTAQTTGTIVSIKMPNPETAKARNSKWAIVTYDVGGKIYRSQNRIQVPMTAQIGSTITVRYALDHPEKLYHFSSQRMIIAFGISVVCILVATFQLI